MEIVYTDKEKERKDKQTAKWVSFLLHFAIIIALFLPILKFPIPPPEEAGLLVSFGKPDEGMGNDKLMGGHAKAEEEIQKEPEVPTPPPPPPGKVEETKPETPKVKESAPEKTKEIATEDPEAIALRKKQKAEAAKAAEAEKIKRAEEVRIKKEADEKARADADALKRKVAAEEARKKAEADAAAKEKADLDKAKSQYGDVFGKGKGSGTGTGTSSGNGTGTGRGDTNKPGNQGDPNGDPNSDNLKGISTGSGKIGGGLGGRGVSYAPKVQENSQKTGRVVINVCVDKNGKVITANYTQKGSTTTDAGLRQIAEDNSKNFKFSASDIEQQCGTITYDFVVK